MEHIAISIFRQCELVPIYAHCTSIHVCCMPTDTSTSMAVAMAFPELSSTKANLEGRTSVHCSRHPSASHFSAKHVCCRMLITCHSHSLTSFRILTGSKPRLTIMHTVAHYHRPVCSDETKPPAMRNGVCSEKAVCEKQWWLNLPQQTFIMMLLLAFLFCEQCARKKNRKNRKEKKKLYIATAKGS